MGEWQNDRLYLHQTTITTPSYWTLSIQHILHDCYCYDCMAGGWSCAFPTDCTQKSVNCTCLPYTNSHPQFTKIAYFFLTLRPWKYFGWLSSSFATALFSAAKCRMHCKLGWTVFSKDLRVFLKACITAPSRASSRKTVTSSVPRPQPRIRKDSSAASSKTVRLPHSDSNQTAKRLVGPRKSLFEP